MADEEPPDAPLDLGPWLKELQEQAGISTRALAQAMGVDRSNLRDWLNGKGMTAKNLLLFMEATGAKVNPAPPEVQPRAVNAELVEIRASLEELATTVATMARTIGLIADALDVSQAEDEQPGGQASPLRARPTPKRSGGAQ